VAPWWEGRPRWRCSRLSLAAAAEGDEEKDTGYATFFLGRFLWLRGDLEQARELLEQALAMAERIGESVLLGQSLLGLALTALRRHDTDTLRALMPRVLAQAGAMTAVEYLSGAKACLAWLAWQDRRRDDVLALSAEIAEIAEIGTGRVGAFHGLVHLWPLIAAHLDAGDVAAAVTAARRLPQNAPSLPAGLDAAVRAAVADWDQGRPGQARDGLAAALTLARDLRYL